MFPEVRVHLERSWSTGGWNAYIISRGRPGHSSYWKWDGEQWVQADFTEGQMPEDGIHASTKPYSITFPDTVLEAIVAQAIEKLPADGSMANHLKDAQATRDRLLAMIEARGIR